MQGCFQGGLHGANTLHACPIPHRQSRRRCRGQQGVPGASVVSDVLASPAVKPLQEAVSSSLTNAAAQASAVQIALYQRASSAVGAVSSSTDGIAAGVAKPLGELLTSIQHQAAELQQSQQGGIISVPPHAHFGRDALESAWQSVAPQLSQGPPAELSQQLAGQLSHLADQLSRLAPSGAPGAQEGVVQAVLDSARGAQSILTDLAGSLEAGLARGAQALERGPGSLPPHFGTAAALEALQPLRSWLAQHGPATGAWSGYSLNAAGLRRAGSAALQGGIHAIEAAIHSLAAALDSSAAGRSAEGALAGAAASVAAALTSFEQNGVAGYSAGFITAVAAAVAIAVIASSPAEDYDPSHGWIEVQEVPPEYERRVLEQYFVSRPVVVARRLLRVLWAAARWGSGLGIDYLQGRLRTNSALRARQLRLHIERLGPAYVKVAQALSTRVDILDANYLTQIELLQDRVPPFPTEDALEVMQQAWGRPVDAVLSKISDEPVAAASLGQVYRGVLRGVGGREIAVKVQRPDVLSAVALDLYLMRGFALLLQRLPSVTTDWADLIDAWSLRFFSELDYEKEAATAELFRDQMSELQGIVVPGVYAELTSREVLVTEWIQGEKLSESNASDVRELVNTLLNAYLVQLLETGLLHADPHPGNLLRTPSGKVCILDYGLMTEVTQEQSMALVEYIAHLSLQDWAAVPEDLRRLGFISADAPDSSVIAEPLGRVLSQLSVGGGAKGVNLDQITRDIEALTETYPFEIPSYFALILRCFSVLEGIALRVDPSYSIVQECFPYLARRLLQDNDPRIQTALRATLYGNRNRIDIARLQRLASGFSRFTVDGLPGAAVTPQQQQQQTAGGASAAVQAPLVDKNVREALRLVFAPTGSYAAELFAEEAAAAADALGRSGAFAVCQLVLDSVPAAFALSLRAGLPPPVQALAPLGPVAFFDRLQPVVAPTAEDEDALAVVRGLMDILRSASVPAPDAATSGRSLQLARELAPLLPELAPGLLFTAELFLRRLASRITARIAQAGLSRPGQEEAYVPASNFMTQPVAGGSAHGEAAQRSRGPAWLVTLLQSLEDV